MGWEESLEKEMVTHSILGGKFHGQRIRAVTVHGVTNSQTRLSACVCVYVPALGAFLFPTSGSKGRNIHTHTHTHTHTPLSKTMKGLRFAPLAS